MDEIVVDTAGGPRFGVMAPPQPSTPDVPLTAAGLPRKKPGRKPGSTVKPKVNPDGTVEPPKVKRPRKPRDPNAPPIQRKRKAATQDNDAPELAPAPSATPTAHEQPKNITGLTSMRMDLDTPPLGAASSSAINTPNQVQQQQQQHSNPAKVLKREGIMSLLNDDPPPAAAPVAPTRMAFDPVRSTSSSYDPVRETMVTRDPYGTAGLSSPRAPSQMPNRASASPSISSLVDPPVAPKVVSPSPGHASFPSTTQSRFQEPSSLPPSPSQPLRKELPSLSSATPKPATGENKKPASSQPSKAAAAANTSMAPPPSMPGPSSKKIAAVQAQTRKEKKASSGSSSPKMSSLKNALPDVPPLPGASNDRSILDFGKAAPGEEKDTPSIVISIPLNADGNKYINFMRLAEEKYGWDALHPRQAADRERKARIAAAAAALEKQQTGRESAEEEDPDNSGSDEENSNVEMGGMGNNGGLTSGADAAAPEKPKRRKRNWREDEYDRDDGFVDDSEMLWEEQAAAVKDGFFVYSGPLVPEAPKPAVTYVLAPILTTCRRNRMLTIFTPTVTDQQSEDEEDDAVAVPVHVAAAVVARAAGVAVVARAPAAARRPASRASRSSRSSGWRRRRPSGRTWPRQWHPRRPPLPAVAATTPRATMRARTVSCRASLTPPRPSPHCLQASVRVSSSISR